MTQEYPAGAAAEATLTSSFREVLLPLVPGEAVQLLEVVRVDNPLRAPVTLVVTPPDGGSPLASLSLFPPDQPARLAFRAPEGLRHVRIALLPAANRPLPDAVHLRLAAR